MDDVSKLLDSINELCSSGAMTLEESFRLTIEGDSLSAAQANTIERVLAELEATFPSCVPTLLLAEIPVDIDEPVNDDKLFGKAWRLVLPKRDFSAVWNISGDEQVLFFFSEKGLCAWLEKLNPFVKSSTFDPNFDKPVTIRVHGLEAPFGGPSLSVLPLNNTPVERLPAPPLPRSPDVHAIVHTASTGANVQISPNGWALTWGALDSPAAQPLLRLGCLVLGACLASDLKHTDDAILATIRGARQYSLPLWNANVSLRWGHLHKRLVRAVSWVYSERPETRLKLLMDRLTLDLSHGECLLACLYRHLDFALRQAEDSYSFVILDRKDAYYKEMRELMKDMKSQSDHYATKTRDMVTALLRDFLGVLVFIAFAFIGKFDQKQLKEVLDSQELGLFLKFLACYLAISFFLQLAAVMRDDVLTHREASKWLDVLRNYTSSKDNQDNFRNPIQTRRQTLHYAMIVSAVLYGLLVISIWSLPHIVHLLL